MTTLEEFKETCRKVALLFPCGIDRVSDEQYLDAHRKEVGEALHAFPALIAVAEGMAETLRKYAKKSEWSKSRSDEPWCLLFNSSDNDGHGDEIATKALAAFEAWKLNIEKGD